MHSERMGATSCYLENMEGLIGLMIYLLIQLQFSTIELESKLTKKFLGRVNLGVLCPELPWG